MHSLENNFIAKNGGGGGGYYGYTYVPVSVGESCFLNAWQMRFKGY